MLVPVRFCRSDGRYNSGEVAGFDAKVAAELVRRGVAVYLTKAAAPPPQAPPPPAREEPKALRITKKKKSRRK